MSQTARAAPTTKRVDQWKSPEIRGLLEIRWRRVPPSREAPGDWQGPFLLYVVGGDSHLSQKLERSVFGNTAVALATRAFRAVRITPSHAATLNYLQEIRIRDPMIVVLDSNLRTCGVLDEKKKFTAKRCLAPMVEAVGDRLDLPLCRRVDCFVKHLDQRERLWKEKLLLARKIAKARSKTGGAGQEIPLELEVRRNQLLNREEQLKAETEEMCARFRTPKTEIVNGPQPSGSPLLRKEEEALRTYRNRRREAKGIPYLEAKSLQVLRGLDSPEIARRVLCAARDGDSWSVWEAARGLREMRAPCALQVIRESLSSAKHRERTAALLAFSKRSDPAAVPRILNSGRSEQLTVRMAAIRAMGAQRDEETAAALGNALKDPHPEVRLLAARAVGRRGLGQHMEAVVPLLVGEDWCVRKAAVECLGALRDARAVPVLVSRMSMVRGLGRVAANDALVELTGQPILFDPDEWADWWREAKGSFSVPQKRKSAAAADAIRRKILAKGWPGHLVHHSIGTYSRRIVFLVDVSESMGRKMPLPATVRPEVRKTLWSGCKLDLAKRELLDTLEDMDREIEFNIIAYAGGVYPWRKSLAPTKERKRAAAFVKALKVKKHNRRSAASTKRTAAARANRATVIASRIRDGLVSHPGCEHERNLYAALLTAFGVLDPEPLARRERPDADTIFLIVDGPPSVGEVLEVECLVEILRELNCTRGVVLHVVAFSGPTRHVMKPLAEITGGHHVLHSH